MADPPPQSTQHETLTKLPDTQTDRKNYIVGICLLLVVVFLWTSSNFVTQGLFDEGYEKPFVITYLSTSTFALYLVPFFVRRIIYGNARLQSATRARNGYQPLATEQGIPEMLTPANADQPTSNEVSPLSMRETANLAAWFCFLWFIANWSLNASLGYTSVASATILSSMSGFFTLALGRLFRVEALTYVKIAAVMASFGGVILVSLSDSSNNSSDKLVTRALTQSGSAPIVGDTLALLSALFYALYVILLKVKIRDESRIDMQLFFGFVGLFNILATWPIGIILHFTGIERFELPSSGKTITGLLINCAITLSSDYIYVIAMLKTTPLVVTVGLSLTMPLAVLGDFILKKPAKLQVILGAAVVLLSFVAVGLEDSKNKEEDDLIAGRPLEEEGDAVVRLEEDVPFDGQTEGRRDHQ
ncbi:SLC35F solute transporter family protein [Abortiporus biennis]